MNNEKRKRISVATSRDENDQVDVWSKIIAPIVICDNKADIKLQIRFEVSLVYLTILEAAPTVTICDGALESVLCVMAP